MKTVSLLFLLLAGFAAVAFASQKELLQLDSAFANGEYDKVELLALRLLQNPDSLTSNDQARVNLTAGYALIMLGREQDARGYFRQAIKTVPTLELDPTLVSPKFRGIFDEVKASYKRVQDTESQQQHEVRVTQRALLANLILPGSGRMMQGQVLHGAIVTTVQVASVVWFIKSLADMQDSRKNYLRASDPAEIASRYDTYDKDHQTAWVAGLVAGTVYLAAQADLILLKPRQKPPVKLALTSSSGLGLALSW